MLNSARKTWPNMLNAFPTALDHCMVCLRPAFERGGVSYPAQLKAVEDSASPGTSFGVCA
jgi:hypothetical protein